MVDESKQTPAEGVSSGAGSNSDLGDSLKGDASLESQLESLKIELGQMKEQAEQQRDLALRMRAEADNVRKRAERDVQSAHKFGLEKFVTELLGVVDSLERAIDSMGTADNENDAMKSAREGLTLTLKMFAEALVKQGVMPVNPKPKDMFDPSMHEAMAMVENPDQEGGTILQLIQKGYWLNDRLIRPARVIVVKQDQPKLDEEA